MAILAVGSALLVQFIDQTALATALPTLARAFRTDPVQLKLSLTAYILVQAMIVPASGWVADRFGTRRVFIVVTLLFVVGSVCCGLSTSLWTFILSRVVQGAGAAMMVPLGRSIVVAVSPRQDLVKSMILLTTPGLVGPLIGPPLTGFILAVADWPWVFYLNVPIGLAGVAAVYRFVPRLAGPRPARFDMIGFGLAALAIGAATTMTETFGAQGWALQLAGCLIAIGAGMAFLLHCRRIPHPILDLSLFRLATYRASVVGGIFVRLSLGGMFILSPLFLQIGCGWSPLKAGSIAMIGAAGSVLPSPLVPRLIRTFGFRGALVTNIVLLAGAAMALAATGPHTPVWLIAAIFLVQGFASGVLFTALNTIAYADTPPGAANRATTLYSVVQLISASSGVTLGALLLSRTQAGEQATAGDFVTPLFSMALVLAPAVLVFLRLPRDAGGHLVAYPRRNLLTTPSHT